jgi:hypothetical protein
VISPTELAAALNLPTPTEQQQRVIAAPLQPHIIIAGAGSGKTSGSPSPEKRPVSSSNGSDDDCGHYGPAGCWPRPRR